jgi:ABC-type nickel/cobalt efflux system permease component RcnA
VIDLAGSERHTHVHAYIHTYTRVHLHNIFSEHDNYTNFLSVTLFLMLYMLQICDRSVTVVTLFLMLYMLQICGR